MRDPITVGGYARAAKELLDPAVWDFFEGGAGEERTLAANLAAFDRVRLLPSVLTGVVEPEPAAELLGGSWAAPIAVAPMGYQTLADPEGELATVRAAGQAGIPVIVSTFSGRSFADLAAEAKSPLWLQLYCFRDRALTRSLVERAEHAGFEAVVLTVDTPRLGLRPRDLRNDFRLPPGITPANLVPATPDPANLGPASLGPAGPGPVGLGSVGLGPAGPGPADLGPGGLGPVGLGVGVGYDSPAAHALAEFDAGLDWGILDWLRSVTGLPILLKGVLTAADAARAVEAGAAGIIVSNHGGRQLDGAVAALDALPGIAATVDGACPVLLDGGIRRGTDILTALALGADAVLLGRPVLHGLAVAGQQGVARVLDLLIEELTVAMTLTGTPTVREVRPDLLTPGHSPHQPTETEEPAPHAAETAPRAEEFVQHTAGLVPPAEGPVSCAAGAAPRVEGPVLRGTGAVPCAGGAATRGVGVVLRGEELHRAVADPVLETMNFLNEVTVRYPEAISFAPGRPYDGFFDTEQIFTQVRGYLDHLAAGGDTPGQIRDAVFQYGPAAGRIRGVIADALRADEGIEVQPEAIVVTVGAQEAMFLVLRALMAGPEDVLLVSSPCYVGITGAARLLDVEVVAVREREDGLSPLDVEAVIRAELARGRRPRAVYVVPDHSNPSGVTMRLPARRALLDVAARHDVLILEDSPYRLVSPGAQVPTLKSLDAGRRVVQLGSFSKTVFPGARVGYAVADQEVVTADGRRGLLADELAKIKSMVTVNTSPLGQAAVAGAILGAGGRVADLNRDTAAYYGNAMRTTLARLDRSFPAGLRERLGVGWNTPSGGFFLTLRVPFRADNAALTRSAERFGVIWTPMSYFYPEGGGERELRLSVSYLTDHDIEEGITRLAEFIEAESLLQKG